MTVVVDGIEVRCDGGRVIHVTGAPTGILQNALRNISLK